MITPEVLLDIRRKRIKKAAGKAGGGQFAMLAKNYADPEYIYRDLEASRALMRRLGCIVVHTEGRAVEETAQEILRYELAATLQYRHHRLAPATPPCRTAPPAGCSTLFPMLVKKVAETAFCGGFEGQVLGCGAAGCISFTLGSIGVLIARS